jgi:ATP-dependent RNA helicase DDX10/DBP4
MTKKKSKSNPSSRVNIDQEVASLNARIEAETPARGSAPPSGVVAFASLPLSELTLRGLATAKYISMTEIQKASIPHALAGRDILGAAKTGSGKTLSFVVPILECLYRNRWSKRQDGPGAIVLSPTRELAGQIFAVLRKVGAQHASLSVGLLVGGKKDFSTEQQHVPMTNILIATPGRLLQHLEQTPYFQVDNLKMLVLDEADRILDMGFRDQLVRILDYLPKEKQTLLYSATQTKDIKHLATLSMNRKQTEYVGVHDDKAATDTPEALTQAYVLVPLQHKLDCVFSFLKSHLKCKTIVFFASCSQVRHAWELFCALRPGLSVMALHGKLCQSKRTEIYDKFTQTAHCVLFATDVASRGLDFPSVEWVVQCDAPEDQDMYIHRVGRTARYKSKGNSLLLLDPLEESMIHKWTLKGAPLKKKSINPTKTVLVTQKAAGLVAENVKLHTLAKKAFCSYVRSLSLLPKLDFDVPKLALQEYATALGLAIMPNLRFLEKVTSRDGLRATKNVNRKLQKLKDQIKAEKLAKTIAKMGGDASAVTSSSKKRKSNDEKDDEEDSSDDDDMNGLLVVKARHEPSASSNDNETKTVEEVEVPDDYDIHQVAKSRHAKKIRVEGSTSNQNKHVVFGDDGQAQEDVMASTIEKALGNDDKEAKLDYDLAQANEEYMQQVRERLERTNQQDKDDEKQRIRDKHRKKRIKSKGDKEEPEEDQEGAMVATLATTNDDDDDESSNSSDAASSGENEAEEMDVAAQEDLALSLIRGR